MKVRINVTQRDVDEGEGRSMKMGEYCPIERAMARKGILSTVGFTSATPLDGPEIALPKKAIEFIRYPEKRKPIRFTIDTEQF